MNRHCLGKLEEYHQQFAHANEWMAEVTRETDRRSHDMCNSLARFTDEQHDIRKVVEDLARKIDAIQQGTHPRESARSSNDPEEASIDVGVPVLLEIEDVKRKVERLTAETVSKNAQAISALNSLMLRVDATENQIQRWRYRLLTIDGSDDEAIVTAVEAHEQLGQFKGATRRNIEEVRQVIMALEDRVNILRRSRDDTWQLVNDRLTTEVSASLSDRVAGIERQMQSQSFATISHQSQFGQEEFAQ